MEYFIIGSMAMAMAFAMAMAMAMAMPIAMPMPILLRFLILGLFPNVVESQENLHKLDPVTSSPLCESDT